MPHDKKTVGEDWRQLLLDYYAQFVLQLAPESRSKAIQDYITSLLSQIKDEVEKLKELWGRIDGTDNERIAYNQGLIDAAAIIQSYIDQ